MVNIQPMSLYINLGYL